jgi:ribonucleoside-diphosphate reductase alpha chain
VKSLYYCRSLSIQRADNVSEKAIRPDEIVQRPVLAAELAPELPLSVAAKASTDYEECLACQ